MSASPKSKESNLPTVLRRMRESSGLTMRQAAGIVGISHVSISQFENGKLSLPAYRIEALVKAYGFTKEEYHKIMGHEPAVNLRDDCHSMIDRMSDKQVEAIRAVMVQLASANPAQCKGEESGKCMS